MPSIHLELLARDWILFLGRPGIFAQKRKKRKRNGAGKTGWKPFTRLKYTIKPSKTIMNIHDTFIMCIINTLETPLQAIEKRVARPFSCFSPSP